MNAKNAKQLESAVAAMFWFENAERYFTHICRVENNLINVFKIGD